MFDFSSPGGPTFFPSPSGGITSPFSLQFGPSAVAESQASESRQAESGKPWYVDLIEAGVSGTVGILRELQGRTGQPANGTKYAGATAGNPQSGGAVATEEKSNKLLWVALGVGVLALGAAVFSAVKK